MIRYDRLWDTMKEKGITQYRLIKGYGFSAGQIGRLKKNMHVSTHTLETLCSILECRLEDIAEYIPDEREEAETPPALPAETQESAPVPEADLSSESSAPEPSKASSEKKAARKSSKGKDKKGGKSKKGKSSKKK